MVELSLNCDLGTVPLIVTRESCPKSTALRHLVRRCILVIDQFFEAGPSCVRHLLSGKTDSMPTIGEYRTMACILIPIVRIQALKPSPHAISTTIGCSEDI